MGTKKKPESEILDAEPLDKKRLAYARKKLKEIGAALEVSPTLAQDLNEIRRLRLVIDGCRQRVESA